MDNRVQRTGLKTYMYTVDCVFCMYLSKTSGHHVLTVHLPPFRQGWDAQSSIFIWQLLPVYPGWHVHLYELIPSCFVRVGVPEWVWV